MKPDTYKMHMGTTVTSRRPGLNRSACAIHMFQLQMADLAALLVRLLKEAAGSPSGFCIKSWRHTKRHWHIHLILSCVCNNHKMFLVVGGIRRQDPPVRLLGDIHWNSSDFITT